MTVSFHFDPFAFAFRKKRNHLAWKIAGGVVLAAVAAGVINNFPDLKRYVKMSRM